MTTTDIDTQVIQAEAYVRSRFYPPLPYEYGRLAVEAVDAVNREEPEAEFDVSDLPIQPKGTDERGMVRADELVRVLRLEHLIEEPCPDPECDAGWNAGALEHEHTREAGEAVCPTCNGRGVV